MFGESTNSGVALYGNTVAGSIERLRYVHRVQFFCWSNEVDLIGKTARVSIEQLRYEHC
jgi:hypothetical protein